MENQGNVNPLEELAMNENLKRDCLNHASGFGIKRTNSVDIYQDAMRKILERGHREGDNLCGLLYATFHRLCLYDIRPKPQTPNDDLIDCNTPFSRLERRELSEVLSRVLQDLGEDGELLRLKYYSDLSKKDIAKKLGIGVTYVGAKLAKARRRLKWYMSKKIEGI